jgi:UDP-2,3-diacylglucosamine hydrolase
MQFFISDLHLSPTRPEITSAFLDFLNTTAKNAETLYILGDFFDAWVGDDDDTPAYLAITKALSNYSKSHSLFFMHGNRDFLIGSEFAKQAGLTLLDDPCTIDVNGTPTLLMHGDTLCTNDIEYISFREMVRNPKWQQNFLQKPLSERKNIAQEIRSISQSMSSLKAQDITDVTPDQVIKVMAENSTVRLIHGHTHRPARHNLSVDDQPAERIVLGDWHHKGWYLVADGSELNLKSFDI